MPKSTRVARQATVAQCQKLLAIEPLLASIDEDLIALTRRASQQPQTRLIGVQDRDGRVVGMIPIARVAESVIARVDPEALLSDIAHVADIARFGHAIEDRVAGDIMLPPATIRPDATIGEAFRIMHQRRISGLHVVDPEGRPVGYLDLLELALLYADALTAPEA